MKSLQNNTYARFPDKVHSPTKSKNTFITLHDGVATIEHKKSVNNHADVIIQDQRAKRRPEDSMEDIFAILSLTDGEIHEFLEWDIYHRNSKKALKEDTFSPRVKWRNYLEDKHKEHKEIKSMKAKNAKRKANYRPRRNINNMDY